MTGSLSSRRRHPWAAPGAIICAGQSNAVNVWAFRPSPLPGGAAGTLVAAANTSLAVDWQPGQPGGYRAALIAAVGGAAAKVVVIWLQGENDAGIPRTQAQYFADFQALYNQVNNGRADVLWVLAPLSRSGAGAPRFNGGNKVGVRLAQEQAIRTLPNVSELNVDDYVLELPELVHYNDTFKAQLWTDAVQVMAAR